MSQASTSRRSIFRNLEDFEDDSISSGQVTEFENGGKQTSYLTPLQHSLVFELTTRRKRIELAERRVQFWEQHDEKRRTNPNADDLDRDIIDEEYLDDLIKQRKARLAELQQSQRLKESIVESADAAHSINASMAAIPPAGFSQNLDSPLCIDENLSNVQQPLRSIASKRDENSLKFLRLQDQIKFNEKEKDLKLQKIQNVRQITSNLVKEIKSLKKILDTKKLEDIDLSTSITIDRQEDAQERIQSLQDAINLAKGKREMVKGVLRGLILESGLDWHKSKRIRKLVLSLGDDEIYSSDEDINLYSDEEERDSSSEEGEEED